MAIMALTNISGVSLMETCSEAVAFGGGKDAKVACGNSKMVNGSKFELMFDTMPSANSTTIFEGCPLGSVENGMSSIDVSVTLKSPCVCISSVVENPLANNSSEHSSKDNDILGQIRMGAE